MFKRAFNCIAFLFALSLLISCNESQQQSALYYPIDSLIHAQVDYLVKSKALLTKKAEIDGVQETNSFTPKDTTTWAHELDIFAELNTINKPINEGNYKVENGIKDVNSNLTIYSLTSTKELPVVYLKVFYLDVPSKVRRIEALFREENSMLKGSRFLIMEFQEIQNKEVLTYYSIEGGQKMFLGNSVKFSVRGTVTLP